MSNVTQLNPKHEPDLAELMAVAHQNGAARAVHTVRGLLAAEHKRLNGDDSTAVKAATYAYEVKLDDHDLREKAEREKSMRPVLLAVSKLHWSICDDKVARDKLATKADDAKKARKSRIDSFEIAEDELLQQRPDANQKVFPFADGGSEGQRMLGHTTKATKAVVYAALLHVQTSGVSLDPYQVDVLAGLSSEGVETIDLGFDPADAVEHDEGEEPEGDDIDPADDPF